MSGTGQTLHLQGPGGRAGLSGSRLLGPGLGSSRTQRRCQKWALPRERGSAAGPVCAPGAAAGSDGLLAPAARALAARTGRLLGPRKGLGSRMGASFGPQVGLTQSVSKMHEFRSPKVLGQQLMLGLSLVVLPVSQVVEVQLLLLHRQHSLKNIIVFLSLPFSNFSHPEP